MGSEMCIRDSPNAAGPIYSLPEALVSVLSTVLSETAGADGSSGGWGFPCKSVKTEELPGALSAKDLLRIIYRCHGISAIGVSAYGPGIILRQHSASHHHLHGGGRGS